VAFMIRLGAVSILSGDQAQKVEASLAHVGNATLHKFESSEGGDKVYLRFDKNLDNDVIKAAMRAAGTESTQVQSFGPPEDHTYEVTLIGMDGEVRKALDAKLGRWHGEGYSAGFLGGCQGWQATSNRRRARALRRHLAHRHLRRLPLRFPLRPGHHRGLASRRGASPLAPSRSPTRNFPSLPCRPF
jgi:hypothetical protein